MKKLYMASAITAAFLTAPLAAQAATGQTSVSFTLPGIVILHYASDITIEVPASYFGGADQSFDDSAAKTLTGFDDDAAVTVTGGPTVAALENATTFIRNAWAVRSLSSSGNSQVAITLDNGTATGSSGTIAVSNPQVSADGATFGGTTTFASPGLSTSTAEYGDVSLDVDMSAAASAGTYTGVLYTVEATNI
ncbi:hypothetical protein ACLUEY_05755 [Vreelandella aquamarina]